MRLFFKQHPTFDYDTPEASYRVEVFTVYETTTDFYYIDTDFTKPAAFAQYLQDVKKTLALRDKRESN